MTSQELPSEVPEVIRAKLILADQLLKPFAEALGENFDYGLRSLGLLEHALQEAWPEPPKDAARLDALVEVFGAYLGESLRRIYGGRWVIGEGLPFLVGPHHPACKLYPLPVIFQKLAHQKPIQSWVVAYSIASKAGWKP